MIKKYIIIFKGDNMKYKEKIINKNYLYQGKIINLRKDLVELPNKKTAYREIIEHNGGVCALAVKGNHIYLVRQYRLAYDEELLELPAGKIEKGGNPDETIIRELKEEIGAIVHSITKVGVMYPTPGYTNEIIHLYYTDDFSIETNSLDEDEFLDVEIMKPQQVFALIDHGEIKDAKTLILLLYFKDKLLKFD